MHGIDEDDDDDLQSANLRYVTFFPEKEDDSEVRRSAVHSLK